MVWTVRMEKMEKTVSSLSDLPEGTLRIK